MAQGSLSILMIFLDGVGLGQDNPSSNPFLSASLPHLRRLLDGQLPLQSSGRIDAGRAILIPTDPTLGVAGTPQSATGQASLFTGVNAALALGRHWGPYPNEPLRQIIRRDSIFKKLAAQGQSAYFANAYPERYFRDVARGKRGLSASGLAATAGGLRLLGYDDLRDGRALSAFLTNEGWRTALGYADVPAISYRQAGQTLATLAGEHRFSLFEHYYTDVCGHHQDWPAAIATLEAFDEFLAGVLDGFDDERMLLIVTSDHGNIEDLTVRGHTLNPVPTLVAGRRRHEMAASIANLCDVAPAVLHVLPA